MRFGRTLSEETIPEWRSKYLNYDQGKKLLHRLEKGLEKPATTGPSPSSFNTDAGLTDLGESLQLPSPALAPRKTLSKSNMHSAENLSRRPSELKKKRPPTEITDQSPLLDEHPVSIYGQAMADFGTPAVVRPANQAAVTRNATDVFFNWLAGEVNKIEAFFLENETEAVKRGNVLERQIRTLVQHKVLLKKTKQPVVQHGAAALLERFDFPSLPACFSPKGRTINSDSHRDYGFRAQVSYAHAKQMLKRACYDYYQNLLRLKSFRALNETGIRKIVKKFDKTFGTSMLDSYLSQLSLYHMQNSKELDDLTDRMENLYAETFENGHHKFAVEKLQRGEVHHSHNGAVLLTGLLIGGGLPLFVRAIYAGVRDLHRGNEFAVRFYLQIWAGFFFVDLILLLLSLNLYVWQFYRINYMFIFEFNRANALDYRQFPVLPAALFFMISLMGWVNFDISGGRFIYYIPCLFLGLIVAAFAAPVPIYWKSRKWMMIALWRLLLSGLYPVEFRDFFLGDIFCSLNYSVSNMALFFCLFGKGSWWNRPVASEKCGSSHSRIMGFLNCLPAIWRFLQCWRRFGDTYDWFPHLLNAGKYSGTILYNVFLSYVRINPGVISYRVLFVVFAVINAVYSSIWDIFMDFSLSFDLRPVLTYPRWSYYVIIVIDPIMRFHWTLYVAYWDQTQQSAKISFIVALIEIVRRFLWVFFRVENEHASNVGQSRAYKDVDLPYVFDDSPKPTSPQLHRESSSTIVVPVTATAPSTPRTSLGTSPRFTAVQGILRRAHTMDFERRQPTDSTDQDDDSDS